MLLFITITFLLLHIAALKITQKTSDYQYHTMRLEIQKSVKTSFSQDIEIEILGLSQQGQGQSYFMKRRCLFSLDWPPF